MHEETFFVGESLVDACTLELVHPVHMAFSGCQLPTTTILSFCIRNTSIRFHSSRDFHEQAVRTVKMALNDRVMEEEEQANTLRLIPWVTHRELIIALVLSLSKPDVTLRLRCAEGWTRKCALARDVFTTPPLCPP